MRRKTHAGGHAGTRTGGFTLVELLVVVAIIGLLISILLPALSRAKEVAQITVCMSNARQIGTGMASYTSECQGYYPAIVDWAGGSHSGGLSWGYTWAEAILPYLSGYDTPPDGDDAVRDATHSLKVYRCASDPNGEHTTSSLGGGGFAAMVGALPSSYAPNCQASSSRRPGSSGNRFDGLYRPNNPSHTGTISNSMPGLDVSTDLYTNASWIEEPSNFWIVMDGRPTNPGYAYANGSPNQPKPDYFDPVNYHYLAVHPNQTNNWVHADLHTENLQTEDTIGLGGMGWGGRGRWTKYAND